MTKLAPIFLSLRGGTAVGHTADVTADPYVTGATFDFSKNVNARVNVGGGVTLSGQTYLDVPALRKKQQDLQRRIAACSASLPAGLRLLIDKKMAAAASALGPDSSTPSFQNCYEACNKLKDAEDQIKPYEK
jgi:hypothetical protein